MTAVPSAPTLPEGSRVRWAPDFLARNATRDPKWHAWANGAAGTVVCPTLAGKWPCPPGMVPVQWDGDRDVGLHHADRIVAVVPQCEHPSIDVFIQLIIDEEIETSYEEFVHYNAECMSEEEFAEIAALAVGESITMGGGAWARFTVRRVS